MGVTNFDQVVISGAMSVTRSLVSADGTAAAPAFSWTSDPNTGVYRLGADQLGLAVGGGTPISMTTTQVNLNRNTVLTNGSGTELLFSGDLQTDIKSDDSIIIDFDRDADGAGANRFEIRAGGVLRLLIHDEPKVIQQGPDSDTPTVWQYKCGDALANATGSDLEIKSGESAGTNQAGSILRLMGGQNTGSGVEGPIILATATVGASGAVVSDHTERARITAAGLKFAEGMAIIAGTATGMKIGSGATEKLGLWGKTPVVQSAAYTVNNPSVSRTIDVSTATLAQLAAFVGTLASDLKLWGGVG